VKRGVVARDGGRCTFVARSGHRCGERRFLEFHHVIPHAAGGKPTLENIQLRCRAHNVYEAVGFFGPDVRRTRGESSTRSGATSPKEGRTTIPGLSP